MEESGRETETVKVYEMLAAGLPVVATDLPELRRLVPLERQVRCHGAASRANVAGRMDIQRWAEAARARAAGAHA